MLKIAIAKENSAFREEKTFDRAAILTIGRLETNDLVLPDPQHLVSRCHAVLIRLLGPEEEYFIRDLSSRNSTWVGTAPVCRKRLRHGDVVKIGEYRLTCYFQEAPAKAAEEEDLPLVVDERKSLSPDSETLSPAGPTRVPVLHGAHEGTFPGDPRRAAIEELLRQAQVAADAGEIFAEFIGPILRAVDADRGFIALFREGSAACQCIARQLGKNEKIRIADPSFRETLRKGMRLEEGRVLLVPLFAGKEVVGFFCANRKPPKPAFSLEDGDFLEQLGSRITALRKTAAGAPTGAAEAVADEDLEWPMGLVGNSEGMRAIYQQVEEALRTEAAVLLTGETGTGKELVATALHQRSPRAAGPWVPVNCSTISRDVPELVLFGYPPHSALEHSAEEGSPGLIEQAHQGTLFLDEIQSMSLKVQPQLLRVMEEKKVRRIGGREAIPIDVRFIGATNEDLERKVVFKEFRADLYERFEVRIFLPSLRQHREDIPLLAHYFIDHFALEGSKTRWISRAALQRLMEYDWPGNVRELRRCIQQAVADDREVIFSWDLFKDRPLKPVPPAGDSSPQERRKPRPMVEIEKEALQEALEWTKGNKSQAAKLLGWSWQTLDNKMKRYGLSA